MFKCGRALLLGLVALAASSSSTVNAQDASGLGYAYLFGYGAPNTPAIRSFVPAPPYFSLHPPVYYGKRYTRPYGESPFASWPQLQAAPGYRPRPAVNYAPAPVVINMPGYHHGHAEPALPAPTATPAVPGPSSQPAPAPELSPVIQNVRPIQPLVINNPYFKAEQESTSAATRLVNAQ